MADSKVPHILEAMYKNYLLMAKHRQGPGYSHQGSTDGRLFRPDYEHPTDQRNCSECDGEMEVERLEQSDHDPMSITVTLPQETRSS